MFKIAICDDEQREIEIAKKNVQLYFASHPELNAEIYEYTSAMELLGQIEDQGGFDVLLMIFLCLGFMVWRRRSSSARTKTIARLFF